VKLWNDQSAAGYIIYTACKTMQSLFEVIAYTESTAEPLLCQHMTTPCC